MSSWIEWLLDLENIRFGRDAPLMLRWSPHVEAWMLFCIALAVGGWIFLIYRRERTSIQRRIALSCVRCLIFALLVALICGPSLVLQRNRIEPSFVALVLDTSQSMATKDTYEDDSVAHALVTGSGLNEVVELANHSRLDLIHFAFRNSQASSLRTLLHHNAIQLMTFSSNVEEKIFVSTEEAIPDLLETIASQVPDGQTTDLAGAIVQVIEKSQGRRLAGIILATDGQSTQPTNLKDALDLARSKQIPILPIRIGSTLRTRDIEVGQVRSQEIVFVKDILAVEAQLSARGLTEQTAIEVKLIDERSGDVVATETVMLDPAENSQLIELRTKPKSVGRSRYRIEAVPLHGERVTNNNMGHVDVTVLNDRLRVLYVDSYPRYEYRYLKNALIREQTLDLSVLLLEADERFVQEGTNPIRRFPETPEELSRYDVVLFGDVDPRSGWLSEAQMSMLLDFVGNQGGGFGLLAGERSSPNRFAATPLEKLIPVRIDPSYFGHEEIHIKNGYRPQLTSEGKRSSIFRFTSDREENERMISSLPELYWIARTLGPKPGASILLQHPTLRCETGPMPVVVTGRYGAGKIYFQATDDTWRWRRHTGELLHDMYWVQVTRELMRGSRVSQDRRYVIRTDRKLYDYSQPIHTRIEIFDTEILAQMQDKILIQMKEISNISLGDSTTNITELKNNLYASEANRLFAEFEAHRLSAESNVFEGSYIPGRAGNYMLEAVDIVSHRLDEKPVSVWVRVERPDLEAKHVEADHEILHRIADSTNGIVIDLDQLDTAFASIRDRSVRIPDDITEPLWDSKLAIILFVILITTEWIMRKTYGLL